MARSSSKYSSTAKTRHVRYVNDTFVKYAREFAREATLGGAVRVDDVIAAVELELGDVNAVSDGTFIDARWGIENAQANARECLCGYGRARARIDVMGGVADYSGATVAQLSAANSTRVMITVRDDRDEEQSSRLHSSSFRVVSTSESGVDVFEGAFEKVFHVKTFEAAKTRAAFEQGASHDRWAAYVAGTISELFRAIVSDDDAAMVALGRWIRELGARGRALDVFVSSDVPRGKGVASSAALEVATARAMVDLMLRNSIVARDNARFIAHCAMLPLYCHSAENNVVGAPCGFMDQYACFWGQPGRFLALNCDLAKTSALDRAVEPFRHVTLPHGLRIYAIDSGVRHSNSGGSDYAHVRCGTFMGRKMLFNEIEARLGEDLACELSLCGTIDVDGWDNGSPGSPESWSRHIDEEMTGELFLARFIRHDDEPYTEVRRSPDVKYALRSTVHHALHENARVKAFLNIIDSWLVDENGDALHRARALGDLMFASHESYNSIKLGSTETDAIVAIVHDVDPQRNHLFGAKITGGGCGGAVCVLASDTPEAQAAIERVRELFATKTGITDKPRVLHAAKATLAR